MALEIEINDLRQVANRIFDHIQKDLKIDKVRIDQDYWDIPKDKLYDPTKDPSDLVLGQLYDDWEFLSSILSDKEQAVSLMFVHLAPLLRYIGEEVGQ